MCLLITQTNNTPISKQKLKNADENNPHGMGFTYSNGTKLIIEKFRNFSKFYTRYIKALKMHGKKSDFLIHFRYSTHGTSDGVFNVHPFKVNNKLVFAHNGVISVKDDKKRSDTRVFNDTILKQLPKNFLSNKATRKLLGEFVSGSKLAFLDIDGNSTIINESAGHWDGGIWYSNDTYDYCGYTYTPITYPTTYTTHTPFKRPKNKVNNLGSCSWCCKWTQLFKVEERVTGSPVYLCPSCKAWNVG